MLTNTAQSSAAEEGLPEAQAAGSEHDVLVLSGGGAKGAYGAGVAKALDAYRKRRGIDTPICYIGTSAGALNAYMLAARGVDALVKFWATVSNVSVLGVRDNHGIARTLFRLVKGRFAPDTPFSFYPGAALERLIREQARLSDIKAPLILAATDYTEGRPKAFYASPLIERLIAEDAKEPLLRRRRLAHLRKIDSDETLVQALLASAAIPVFFPPVQIVSKHEGRDEDRWYIDGGVGNNTPTREAAYFLRYLETIGAGRAGIVYCVKQDAPRVFDEDARFELADILKRSLDVYHYIHTSAIVTAWSRISREVREQNEKVQRTLEWIDSLPVEQGLRMQIKDRVQAEFGKMGGATARLDVPLVEIEPSTSLGDTLEFSPEQAKKNIEHGYNDMLGVLRTDLRLATPGKHAPLDEAEYADLVNKPLFS